MKIKIWPKIRYCDSEELVKHFIKQPLSKKGKNAIEQCDKKIKQIRKQSGRLIMQMEESHVLIALYNENEELKQLFKDFKSNDKKLGMATREYEDLLKIYGQTFDRDRWCEIEFSAFKEDFYYWFKDTFEYKEGYIEGEVEEEELYILDNYDYQVFKDNKWVSREN